MPKTVAACSVSARGRAGGVEARKRRHVSVDGLKSVPCVRPGYLPASVKKAGSYGARLVVRPGKCGRRAVPARGVSLQAELRPLTGLVFCGNLYGLTASILHPRTSLHTSGASTTAPSSAGAPALRVTHLARYGSEARYGVGQSWSRRRNCASWNSRPP